MIKKLIDRYIFNKTIKELSYIRDVDMDFLKNIDQDDHLTNMLEKIKRKISETSLMSNTVQGIQRRNNWIECLEHLQLMCRKAKGKDLKTDYLTMKKK